MPRFFGVPRLPAGYISRDRLLRRLDHPADLTIVRGPAGAGKTTLVSDWARQRQDVDGVWVTLANAEDQSPQAVWDQVLDAMRDAGWLPDADSAPQRPASAAGRERVVVRALRRLAGRRRLVIDRAGLVSAEASQSLLAVLAECPQVDCVIVSRQTQFPVMNAQLSLDTNIIDAGELLLTDDELEEVVTQPVRRLTGMTAGELARTIGRLPLAARAAAVAVQQFVQRPELPADGVSREQLVGLIADASRDLLLAAQLPPDRTAFLRRTSVAPWLDVSLAAELSGLSETEALEQLRRAEREGLGLWLPAALPPSQDRRFAYSMSIQLALRQELRQQSPELVEPLMRRLAQWATRRGDAMLAFRCWIELGDLDAAAAVVRSNLGQFVRFRSSQVLDLIEGVPTQQLRRQPFLTLPLAVTYLLQEEGNARRARELLVLTVNAARLQQRTAAPETRCVLQTVESVALRLGGALEQAVDAADRAMATLDGLSLEQRDDLGTALPEILNQNALTYLRGRRLEQAQNSVSTSFAITGPNRAPDHEFHASAIAAAIRAVLGDLPAAERVVQRIDERWTASRMPQWMVSPYRLARMILAVERFDFAAAETEIRAVPYLRWSELRAMFGVGQALVHLGTGRAMAAYEQLTELRLSDTGPVLSTPELELISSFRGLALHCAGHPQRAEQELSSLQHQRWAQYVRAIAALAADDAEGALGVLNGLADRRPSSDGLIRTLWLGNVSLVLAACFLRLDREEAALAELEAAAESLARSGRRLPLMLLPAADLHALAALAAAHDLRTVLDVFGDVADVPDVLKGVRQTVRLTERELLVLQALARSGSVQQIAAELSISANTVKTHRQAIYRKLGVGSRMDALMAARQHDLISDPLEPR